MAGRLLISHIFLLPGFLALLAMITTDTYAEGGKIKEKDKESAAARKKRETQLLSQLQARFQAWDTNKDNVLDLHPKK